MKKFGAVYLLFLFLKSPNSWNINTIRKSQTDTEPKKWAASELLWSQPSYANTEMCFLNQKKMAAYHYSNTIILVSVLNLWGLVGQIQTAFQIQYKGNYSPNSCIQSNLHITSLLQLEFIWGLSSGFRGERPRIWHGQDLCKELQTSFVRRERSDREEGYCKQGWRFSASYNQVS